MGCHASRLSASSTNGRKTPEQVLDASGAAACQVLRIANAKVGGSGGFISNAIMSSMVKAIVHKDSVKNIASLDIYGLNQQKTTITDDSKILKFFRALAANRSIALKHFVRKLGATDEGIAKNLLGELDKIYEMQGAIKGWLNDHTAYDTFTFKGTRVIGFSIHMKPTYVVNILHFMGSATNFNFTAGLPATYSHLHFIIVRDCNLSSLADMIDARKMTSLDLVKALDRKLTASLKALHRRGIFFNDLKPGNVVLCRDSFRLIDYEMAIREALPLFDVRNIAPIGSPAYLSPWALDVRLPVMGKMECIGTDVHKGRLSPDDAVQALIAKIRSKTVFREQNTDPEKILLPQFYKAITEIAFSKRYWKIAALSYFKWCQTNDPLLTPNRAFLNKMNDMYALAILYAYIMKSNERAMRHTGRSTAAGAKELASIKAFLKERVADLITLATASTSVSRTGRTARGSETQRLLNRTPRTYESADVHFGNSDALDSAPRRGSRNRSSPKV